MSRFPGSSGPDKGAENLKNPMNMTPQLLVQAIRTEIIDGNLATYRDLFEKADVSNAGDPYFKRACGLHRELDSGQKEVLFQIIREVMVDTCSDILGKLDGVSSFDGQTEDFNLTMEGGDDRINGDLQDLLLGAEEEG